MKTYGNDDRLLGGAHGDEGSGHRVIVSRHSGHQEGLQGLEGQRGDLAHNAKVNEPHSAISQDQQVACTEATPSIAPLVLALEPLSCTEDIQESTLPFLWTSMYSTVYCLSLPASAAKPAPNHSLSTEPMLT